MDSSRKMGIFGVPLVQVFSITIKPDSSEVCQVYGTVQIIDELGEVYLFDCDPKDAATIHHHGTLSLLSFGRSSFAADDFTITLDLKDKHGDAEFIRESFTWNGPNLFSYNNCCLSHDFRGKLGFATIYFSVLSVALDTSFAISINEPEAGVSNIYGKIVAYYRRNFEFLGGNNHNFRLVLFDRTCEEGVELDDDGDIPLLTEYISFPSYSSLVVEANLHYTRSSTGNNSKGIIDSRVEILPSYHDTSTQRQDGAFIVGVRWTHPYHLIRLPSLDMVSNEKFQINGNELLELFSARIFYDETTVEGGSVEIYGGIHIDGGCDVSLFSSRKKNCKLILPDGTLALRGASSWINGSYFDLFFKVKERHKKFVCDGSLFVNPGHSWEWPDSFACAAIPGKNCYGVLHFAIFDNAVQAELEVTLCSCGNTTSIHGSLIAYYQNYEYQSTYLKNYFRTRLLDIPQNKPMDFLVKPIVAPYSASSVLSNVLEDYEFMSSESGDDDTVLLKRKLIEGDTLMLEFEDELKHEPASNESRKVPLSRKVVAVPDSSSLTIEANLICSTETNNDTSEIVTHLVNGLANFHPQTSGTTSARIGDKDVVIDVKVRWSKYS